VLNTGSRLYNHPALSGQLPEPWLPVLAEATGISEVPDAVSDAVSGGGAVIVDLRRRWSIAKRAVRNGANKMPGVNLPTSASERSLDDDNPARAWRNRSGSSAPVWGASQQGDLIGHAEMEDGASSDEEEDTEGEGMTR